MKLLILFVGTTLISSAGEYAVLSSGFKIHTQTHQVDGDTVHLQTGEGAIDLPASAIVAFEKEEYTPPPPAAPKAVEAVSVGQPVTDVKQLITEAANNAGLPPELVHSIARAESAYRVNAVSVKGAIGLMQLMPGTAAELGADPRDPKQNAEAGAKYLRNLLIKYDGHASKAVAAYNAGPGAVDRYNGVPPYRETVNYVNRVLSNYQHEVATKKPTKKIKSAEAN